MTINPGDAERLGAATHEAPLARRRLPGTPEPGHLWIGAGGIRLAGDCWGDLSAAPVIFLHGGGQTRHAWRDTAARLAAGGYFAVTFDARGHGDSDWPENGDYCEDIMVADLQQLIAALGPRPPVLVGASMGGIISLIAAAAMGSEIAGLILVDVVPRTEAKGSDRVHAFMNERPDGFASLDEAAEAISRYKGSPRPSKDLSGLAKNLRQGNDGRLYWHWDPNFMNWPRDLERRHQRLSACARLLKIPTLLVRGGSSDVVAEEGVNEFLQLCPHAEYVNVADAGHMVSGDRNDQFGRHAIAFLARVAPAA